MGEGQMFKKLFIVVAATTAVTPAAFAADLYAPVVMPATYTSSGFDWSGFYAGIVGAYSWGRTEATSGTVSATMDPAGGQLGVTVGVNGQFDQFVLGAEGEILWSGTTGSALLGTADTTVKQEWVGAIKARAGVAVENVLIYAHGGFAFTDYNAAGGGESYQTTRTGYTVGVGVEAMMTDNVSAKLEYAYSDFGSWNGNLSPSNTPVDFKLHSHAIKAGVNFHF
jgi:outer membrane immunogenic protein